MDASLAIVFSQKFITWFLKLWSASYDIHIMNASRVNILFINPCLT